MPEKKNFVLRLDPGAYKALEKWATDEFRSVNGQIEYLLNQALKEQFGSNFQQKFGKINPESNSKDLSEDGKDNQQT